MLGVAVTPACYGEVFNIGGGAPTSFIELANLIVELAGEGSYRFAEFTRERKEDRKSVV